MERKRTLESRQLKLNIKMAQVKLLIGSIKNQKENAPSILLNIEDIQQDTKEKTRIKTTQN